MARVASRYRSPGFRDDAKKTAKGVHGSFWRTTEVTIKPLSQVDEAFAWDEGEGDRTAGVVAPRPSPLFRSASGCANGSI